MRLLEKLSFLGFLVGFFFKWMHWPGSGALLIISLPALGLITFLQTLGWQREDPEDLQAPVASRIFLGLTYLVISLGILFRMLVWPGGNVLITTGGIMLIFALVFVRDYIDMWKWPHFRMIFFIVLVGFFRIVSEERLLNWRYPDDPEFVERLMEYHENPGNDSLKARAFNYWYEKDPDHYGEYAP